MPSRFAHILLLAAVLASQILIAAPAQADGHAQLPTQLGQPTNPVEICTKAPAARDVPSGDWITIHPPLRIGRDVYEVAYRRTTGYRVDRPSFFDLLSKDFVAQQGITDLRVTNQDGEVKDRDTIAKVLLLYRAAYHLYEDPLQIAIPPDNPEMKLVLDAVSRLDWMKKAKQTYGEQPSSAEEDLWRAILTQQGERPAASPEAALGPNWEQKVDDVSGLLDLLDSVASSSSVQAVAETSRELADALEEMQRRIKIAGVALPVVTLAVKVAFLYRTGATMQKDRAEWLSHYLTNAPQRAGWLNASQRQAAAAVLKEVQENQDRRLERTEQLMEQSVAEQVTEFTLAKALPELAKAMGSKAASGLLGNVALGLTITGIWYGADAWYGDFTIAQQALDVRAALAAGSAEFRQVALDERADAAGGQEAPYDGRRAQMYQEAYLLEMLAAVQSQRSFSNGYEAIFQIPNFLKAFESIRSTPQRDAAKEAKAEAEQLERKALADFSPQAMYDVLDAVSAQTTDAPTGGFVQRGMVEGVVDINEITAADDRLYALSNQALYILSLDDPDAPEVLTRFPLDLNVAMDVEVYGRCVYVLDMTKLLIIDAIDPAAPKILTQYDIRWPQGAYMDADIGWLSGNLTAYIADGGNSENIGDAGFWPGELVILNLSAPHGIETVRIMSAMGWPATVKVDGQYAYMGLSTGKHGNVGGYRRLSSEADGALWEINTELAESVLAIETAGRYAYFGSAFWGSGHILAVDVADPEHPKQTAALDYGQTSSLLRWGGVLFASTDKGLVALDLRDLSAPEEAAVLPEVGRGDIAAAQGRLYVATWDGIVIVDMGKLGDVPFDLPPSAAGGALSSDLAQGTGKIEETPGGVATQRLSVMVENLNVRAGPGRDFAVLAQVDTGTELAVVGRSADDSWLAVCCANGQAGWVIADDEFIRYDGDIAALPVQKAETLPTPATTQESIDTIACPIEPSTALSAAGGGLGCAQNEASITWAAYTPFEKGFILWRRDTGRIYGFFDDGTWLSVQDVWDGSSPTPSRGSPPGGLRVPVRGAGWVWGTNDDFFNRLGWGTGEQTGFCAEVQAFEGGFALRSSTVARCDADNGNPVQSDKFLIIAARDSGGWARK